MRPCPCILTPGQAPSTNAAREGKHVLPNSFYGNGGTKFSKSLNFFWSADFTDRGRCGYRGHRCRLRSGSAKPSYNFASIGVNSWLTALTTGKSRNGSNSGADWRL